MRVELSSAARVVALAALLVAGSLVTGCAAQSAPTPVQKVQHIVAKRTVAQPVHVTVIPDLSYDVAAGVELRLDICMPTTSAHTTATSRPAIVSIHGGSWMAGDKSEAAWRGMCEWLASSGYVVASLDYRLAPTYVYPDQINDVERAVEWLRAPTQAKRFDLDPTLIGAFGGSAGGNLAALLGTAGTGALDRGHRVAAVVELSGPADLTVKGEEAPLIKDHVLSYLGCSSFASCPQAVTASPTDNVDSSDPPFFIGHSQNELIPLSQSLNFVQRLRAAHVAVTFVTMPGTLHSIAMLTPALRSRIVDFFHATLMHPAPAATTS